MAPSQVLTRTEIENLIARGQLIIISNDQVLRLDRWTARHPGGRLPILHMVGKDATDPLSVYHSAETLRQMCKYRIGVIDKPWINIEPPISREGSHTSPTDEHAVPASVHDVVPQAGQETRRTDVQDHSMREGCTSGTEIRSTTGKPRQHKGETISILLQQDIAEHSHISATNHVHDLEIKQDLAEYPSVDVETQRETSRRFQELHHAVRERGLYECKISSYTSELVRYSTLFCLFVATFRLEWFLTSAVFLGLFWHQIMFSAHDAGHLAITQNFKVDTAIGIFIADFCCGLSMGWWKSSHNVHHLVPNHPEHDPDIQNVPIFATSAAFCKSIRSTYYGSIFPWDAAACLLTRFQTYTYYPVMCLARFNLYFLSWGYLLSEKAAKLPSSTWTRPLEIICMVCYWYVFGYRLVWLAIPTWPLRVGFVLISHIATMPLHVQITLSHWGMSTADLGPMESFAQKQLRTTMDISCPAWLDFIHGGLQFQAVHHLFPRLPRHNLREAQGLVKDFCEQVGIKYTIFDFAEGNGVVLGRLAEISKQLEILERCRQDMAANKV